MKRILEKFGYVICLLFFFMLFSTDADAKGVIVKDYKVNSDAAMYGEKCTLSFTIENTEDTFVSDILVTVSTNELIYPVYGKTNQIYVGTIEAEETKTISFEFKISEKAKDVILVPISLDYYIGEKAVSDSNYATIAIPVSDLCEYSVKSIALEQNATNPSMVMLSVSSGNDGNATVYGVVMHLAGDISEGSETITIGDVTAGEQNYEDYYVSFSGMGEKTLKVSFSYQDAHGNWYETPEKVLTTKIEKPSTGNTDVVIGNENNESDNQENKIILICGLLILAIIIVVAVMRWRKK